MTGSSQGRSQLRPWLPGLWLLGLLLATTAFHGVRNDDGFITFRYGQNLALGRGPVFNPGQRQLGSTSPAELLLSGFVYALAGRELTPSVMSGLGCLGWLTQSAALFWLLARPFGNAVALLVAAASALGVAGPTDFVPLETHQTAALSLLALVAAQRKRWKAAAALSALAGLFRPDAYLMAALLGGFCLYELRRRAFAPAGIFLGITAPWLVFATHYYGSPLPLSFGAKFQREAVSDYLMHELLHSSRTWLPLSDAPGWLVALCAWPLVVAGAVMLVRKGGLLALLPVYGFLHLGAYLYLRPPHLHAWHLYPALCALGACLCLAIATTAVAAHSATRWPAGLVFLLVLGLTTQRTVRTALDHPRAYWIGGRHHVYLAVADFLREHGDPGREDFAAVEVGTIAYYADFPVFDMARLVTRSSGVPDGRVIRWVVLDKLLLYMAPPIPPVFHSASGGFEAFVFDLHQKLPPIVRP